MQHPKKQGEDGVKTDELPSKGLDVYSVPTDLLGCLVPGSWVFGYFLMRTVRPYDCGCVDLR